MRCHLKEKIGRIGKVASVGAILATGTLLTQTACTQKKEQKPNVLVVVIDDMGFSDLGTFGSEIRTPNIDRLATNGMCFTNFHASPLSAPTRAMLLTGVDNHQNGLGIMPPLHAENQYMQPGYEGYLNNRVVTLAEVLQQAGYNTYMTGKWHLGALPGHTPKDRGFDRSFAMMAGGAGHFANAFPLGETERPITFFTQDGVRVDTLPPDFYSSNAYANHMIEYISSGDKTTPFFGYLAFTAPHDPLQVPDEWLDKYKGVYDKGFDDIRHQRLERQIAKGLMKEGTPNNPGTGEFAKWDDLSAEEQKQQSRRMEIYASMIECMDYNLGRVIQSLEASGRAENTLIILLSDNGANPKEAIAYIQLSGEGDVSTFDKQYDNTYENMGRATSFISEGGAWAEVSNTPLSYFKMTTGEGGVRTPLIVSGYGVKGKGIDATDLLHVCDLMPTILDFAATTRESQFPNRELAPFYGKSFRSVIEATQETPFRTDDEIICFEMAECKAVIKGNWKALQLTPPSGDGKSWQLYNLSEDLEEKNDLSEQHPEKLKEMVAQWENYAATHGYIKSDGTSAVARLGGGAAFYRYEHTLK